MSQKLASFDFQWEAEAIGLELEKEGIRHEIMPVAREYKTILLGGTDSAAEIWVDERNFERATEVMKNFFSSTKNAQQEESGEKNYLKRVVVFSFLGIVMLPIIFNCVATLNYRKLLQQKTSSAGKFAGLIFLLVGWAFSLLMVGVLYRLR